MSRSGYSDDHDNWDLIRWRGQVASATKGKRGQAFLRELLEALDAMPDKRLIKNDFQAADGCLCTLGVIGAKRGVDLKALDATHEDDGYGCDTHQVGEVFGIARQLAAEIMYENDDGEWRGRESPEERWKRMRAWVAGQIRVTPEEAGAVEVTALGEADATKCEGQS